MLGNGFNSAPLQFGHGCYAVETAERRRLSWSRTTCFNSATAVMPWKPLGRTDHFARCLRIVKRYQAELRRQSQLLGIRVYSEKPRRFVRRWTTWQICRRRS